jgi:hypothetical protein
MIWVAALDPASLTLWYDTSAISGGPGGEQVAGAIHYSVFGDLDKLKTLIADETDEAVRSRSIYFASTIWHEQRHFIDLLLTNYGAYRFRQFLSLYLNLPFIFKELERSGAELVFPIDVYACDVRSRSLRIKPVSESLRQIALDIYNREEWLSFDRKKMNPGCEVGGHAQLEALAALFQVACVQRHFGAAALADVSRRISADDPGNLRYRWHLFIDGFLGLEPTHSDEGSSRWLDASVIPALMIASLAMRAWGQKVYGDPFKRPCSPSGRLLGFLEYFRENRGWKGISVLDAWHHINEIAENLYGRTVLEELSIDYRHEEELLASVQSNEDVLEAVKNAFKQYHALRGFLIEILRQHPAWLLDGNSYAELFLPRTCPIPVNVVPGGCTGEPMHGWKRAFGYKDPDSEDAESAWWWMVVPQQLPVKEGLVAFQDMNPWIELLNHYGPLAKLMMKGRSHRTVLGPELFLVESQLGAAGYKFRFEPDFHLPRHRIIPAVSLYDIMGTNDRICDTCRTKIQKPQGHIVSPWAFRSDSTLAKLAIEGFGGGKEGMRKFVRDWSVWVICDNCREVLSPLFA